MANYILKINDNLEDFNERCDEVTALNDYNIAKSAVNQLKETLKANPKILALAAPQIGIHQRMFVARFGKEFKVFLNPIIISQSKTEFLSEESYVFTNNPKEFIIHRPEEITIAYQDALGNVEQMTLKKIAVTPILQMIDLLDGVLADVLYYTALEIDDSWKEKSKEEKQQIIDNFEQMLKENSAALEEEIKNDDNLSKMQKQIEFNAKYLAGEIKPVDKDGNIIEQKGE